MPISDHYNKIYSENKRTFGNGGPKAIVGNITKYKSSDSVLELGAGEGRNSVFLAEQGFDVTARDVSKVGIEKIEKAAQEKGLDIKTEVDDIRHLEIEANYDVFVCTYVLHHLSIEDALALIKQIQQQTNEDGLNIITTFGKNGDFFSEIILIPIIFSRTKMS